MATVANIGTDWTNANTALSLQIGKTYQLQNRGLWGYVYITDGASPPDDTDNTYSIIPPLEFATLIPESSTNIYLRTDLRGETNVVATEVTR